MANNFGGKTDQNAGNMDFALTDIACLVIFQSEIFSKLFFFSKIFQNTIRVSKKFRLRSQ